MANTGQTAGPKRRGRGFRAAGALVERPVRAATQSRGFAVTRLLTHWAEIVGEDVAAVARPVKVSYARGGLGATLIVLTTGARAPMLQMQEPRLRERINACYGYAAISRIKFTQTAATGFAEGQTPFGGAAAPTAPDPGPAPEAVAEAQDLAAGVTDPTLRAALAKLGAHVLSRR
ncbi:MAG: DUF721 domain-containing protein [Pseudomonadota bacterium]